MSKSNKEIVLEVLKRAFVDRDPTVVDQYFGANYKQHNPVIPDGPSGIAGIIPTLAGLICPQAYGAARSPQRWSQRLCRSAYAAQWSFPGGHVEQQETCAEALVPEAFLVYMLPPLPRCSGWAKASKGTSSTRPRLPTSRRRRRAKTDKIDGETLVRTLLAYKRGEPQASHSGSTASS